MVQGITARALAGLTAAGLALSIAAPASAEQEQPEVGNTRVSSELDDPDKSIAFYVGKNLTEAGHTLLGGFGHEPSSHWLEIVPAQDHPEGATVEVGATEDADMPGELTEIPQVDHTYRYITSNYSEFAGFPAPLMNGGLNEHNVAGRDVWSNSREELWDMTPEGQTGPQYSDLSRFAMERAASAREAVEVIGTLIDERGYTTYGRNSHMFADEEEGWVFVQFAGGEGLWAAERLGPEDVRVSYPGYIHEFPVEAVEEDHPDFMGSENLVEFAEEQGWYDPHEDEDFNLQDVYGQPFPADEFAVNETADPDDPAPYRNPISLEEELLEFDGVTLEDMQRLNRDPRWSDDRAGYGQVAELRDDLEDPDLATLWVAPTAAATAPYIPVAIGTEELPVEYTQHRYLTSGAAATFLDPEFAEQEATEYATQTYKRLMYAVCSRPEDHLVDVTAAFEGFDAESLQDWESVIEEASGADDPSEVLTDYSYHRALQGLALGNRLLDQALFASREDGGLHEPEVEVEEGTTASARSQPMELRGEEAARDRFHCDVGGGWPDGNSLERAGEYGDPENIPDYSETRVSGYGTVAEDGDADAAPEAASGTEANHVGLAWGAGGLALGALAGATIVALILRRRKAQ
ncbi:C69 family dipeptidase [Nesterenkonia populi]